MNEKTTAVLALIGALVMLVAMPLCWAWWLWWGYGLSPVDWAGAIIPILVLGVMRACMKVLSETDD